MCSTSISIRKERVDKVESCVQNLVNPTVCILLIWIICYMYIREWVLEPMNGLDFLKVGPTHVHMPGCRCIVALPLSRICQIHNWDGFRLCLFSSHLWTVVIQTTVWNIRSACSKRSRIWGREVISRRDWIVGKWSGQWRMRVGWSCEVEEVERVRKRELIWIWKMLDSWKVKGTAKNEALIELEGDRDCRSWERELSGC